MAATGNFSASAIEYDVFLSFRGSDTRDTFTDCLYRTMLGRGINAFKDDLDIGGHINDILRMCGNSKICIPILSRDYASSTFCLRELTQAMERNKSTGKPMILPIFFDVRPSEVKLLTGLYLQIMLLHEQRLGEETVLPWKIALAEVGRLQGWEVQGKRHGEVIEYIVTTVLHELDARKRPVDSKLVGVDEHVEAIMKLLGYCLDTSVRFVGVHGMNGIGKTTLAKIIFNILRNQFDYQCSFVENIRETSKNGLVGLQKQLASDISDSRFVENFMNTNEGLESIRRRARCKRVLIVLDDVEEKEQLQKLMGEADTFGSGSRIIITTRDKRILEEVEGILTYEVRKMDSDKALELFSLHAFDNVSPSDDLQILSREIVVAIQGLPLDLKIIGSYLRHEDKKIWKEMPERLKTVPRDELLCDCLPF